MMKATPTKVSLVLAGMVLSSWFACANAAYVRGDKLYRLAGETEDVSQSNEYVKVINRADGSLQVVYHDPGFGNRLVVRDVRAGQALKISYWNEMGVRVQQEVRTANYVAPATPQAVAKRPSSTSSPLGSALASSPSLYSSSSKSSEPVSSNSAPGAAVSAAPIGASEAKELTPAETKPLADAASSKPTVSLSDTGQSNSAAGPASASPLAATGGGSISGESASAVSSAQTPIDVNISSPAAASSSSTAAATSNGASATSSGSPDGVAASSVLPLPPVSTEPEQFPAHEPFNPIIVPTVAKATSESGASNTSTAAPAATAPSSGPKATAVSTPSSASSDVATSVPATPTTPAQISGTNTPASGAATSEAAPSTSAATASASGAAESSSMTASPAASAETFNPVIVPTTAKPDSGSSNASTGTATTITPSAASSSASAEPFNPVIVPTMAKPESSAGNSLTAMAPLSAAVTPSKPVITPVPITGENFVAVTDTPLGPCVWKKFPIKVFVTTAPGANGARFQSEVKDAFSSWTQATGNKIRFEFVPNSNADIVVTWVENQAGFRNPKEAGEASVDYHTQGKDKKTLRNPGDITRARIKLMTHAIENREWRPGEVRLVALHEIGHSLGLFGHSTNKNDIMYTDKNATELSARDINTVNMLYSSVSGQ